MGAMEPDVACFLLKNNVINGDEAVKLTSRGKRNITILEMKSKIGGRFGISTRWVILKQVKDAGINSITGVNVKNIKYINKSGKDCITFEKDNKDIKLLADTVIIAQDTNPTRALLKN
tara:strand:+ start:211 stop:564 length:354 start_codon:yes stop_codon:yes gene_type:complete